MLQYSRLKDLQNAAIEADRYMKHLAWIHAPGVLMKNPQWKELVSIWHSLRALVPEEVKNENRYVAFWYRGQGDRGNDETDGISYMSY
eukprot:12131.XXX_346199_346513_1 [CDS] Oithona nana genome sequencing.